MDSETYPARAHDVGDLVADVEHGLKDLLDQVDAWREWERVNLPAPEGVRSPHE